MFWWIVAACVASMFVGVIVGIMIGHESMSTPLSQMRVEDEPRSGVGDVRRTRAPFGVSPHGRPWDDERD